MTSTLAELTRRAQAKRDLPDPPARREIREAAGATLEDVAAAVGVTPQAVALWETGARTPRGTNIENYVAALHELWRFTNVGSYSQRFRLPPMNSETS